MGKFVDYFLETNHEEDRHKSNGKEENAQPQKPPSATPTVNDEGTTTTTPKNSSGSSAKEKQKDEKEVTAVPVASESRPEFQEVCVNIDLLSIKSTQNSFYLRLMQ